MGHVLLSALEALAGELVQRRFAARAAVVSDEGEVLALCASRAAAERLAPPEPGAERPGDVEVVARMAVEALDDQNWIYVDFGSVRLVARLARAAQATAATSWLAGELRRLGVTVEREPLARD